MSLSDVIHSPERLKQMLDAMSHAQRVVWMRRLTKSQLKTIWETVAANEILSLSFFQGPANEEVVYEGKNSLPVFSLFQKRIYRTATHIEGYNRQAVSFLTGPGAFIVRTDGERIVFDYTAPADVSSEYIKALRYYQVVFHSIVYKNLIDQMRLVAANVIIGKAFRKGVDLNEYFILVKVIDTY